jgi:hypothetical protein
LIIFCFKKWAGRRSKSSSSRIKDYAMYLWLLIQITYNKRKRGLLKKMV